MKRFVILLAFAFLLAGCATGSQNRFFDVKTLEQKPSLYAKDGIDYDFNASFLKFKIFEVWDKNVSANDIDHSFAYALLAKDGYKENLQPYASEEKEGIRQKIKECKSVNKNGVMARNDDLRAAPTKKPYFYEPSRAGEGYPFDYFQESSVHINTPVKALCETTDGTFVFVSSFIADGWVDSRNILQLPAEITKNIKNFELKTIKQDKTKLTTKEGGFIESAKIGSFVFASANKLYSASHHALEELSNNEAEFAPLPFVFGPKSLAASADALMSEPYGWGGYLGNRDCSSFLRDLFLPFGLYLPRNSYEQAHFSDFTDLSSLSVDDKLSKIKAKALPFRTLLYLKGHIMLYIGALDGEPIALHDTWGFAYFENGVERRHIIGKPIVSTLFVGSKHDGFDSSRSLASRILGMRILK
jgi:cell wall-associated NlpC family hydrolase